MRRRFSRKRCRKNDLTVFCLVFFWNSPRKIAHFLSWPWQGSKKKVRIRTKGPEYRCYCWSVKGLARYDPQGISNLLKKWFTTFAFLGSFSLSLQSKDYVLLVLEWVLLHPSFLICGFFFGRLTDRRFLFLSRTVQIGIRRLLLAFCPNRKARPLHRWTHTRILSDCRWKNSSVHCRPILCARPPLSAGNRNNLEVMTNFSPPRWHNQICFSKFIAGCTRASWDFEGIGNSHWFWFLCRCQSRTRNVWGRGSGKEGAAWWFVLSQL